MSTERKYDYNELEEYGQHNDGTPHRADANTVTQADTYNSAFAGVLTFDIWCQDCGLSGSFGIDVIPPDNDIQWE